MDRPQVSFFKWKLLTVHQLTWSECIDYHRNISSCLMIWRTVCIFCNKPCCFSSRPTTVLLTYASTTSSISFCKGFLNFNAYICYACFLTLTILLLLHNIVARNPINLKNMLSYTLIKGWIALFLCHPCLISLFLTC